MLGKSNSTLPQARQTGQHFRKLRSQWGTAEDFGDANTRSARMILCDIDFYGGEEALAVRWARRFLERSEPAQKGQHGLFAEAS
jgi:hypothetical protein